MIENKDIENYEDRLIYDPVCKECGTPLTGENWYPSSKEKNYRVCKKCSHEKNKIWQQNNRDRQNQLQRESRQRLRNEIIDKYGGKCACCDETRKEFLSVDHINGNGCKHRREIGVRTSQEFYCWLKQNNYPEGFQVLCFNCNCGKSNFSICPHNKEVFEKEFEAKLKESGYARYSWALRMNIIEGYDGKCELCGESNPHFLTIDHIDGRSLEDNLTGVTLYLKLKNENYPKDNYRLLCYNCNCALGFKRITEEELMNKITF